MRGLDPECVVSLYSATIQRRSSGYLLGPDLILTAAHCVGPPGSAVEVRPLRRTPGASYSLSKALPYRVALRACDISPTVDLALLEPAPRGEPSNPAPGRNRADLLPALGRLVGNGDVPAAALAFPALKERARFVNIEYIQGTIQPLSGSRETEQARLLDLQIRSGVPSPDRSGDSLWSGASGAAVFSGEHLVGVIVQDTQVVADRLQVAPVTGLFGRFGIEAANRYLVTPDGSPVIVHAVWKGGSILEKPYERPPSSWSSADLLQPRYGVVPFVGRATEMAELTEWCSRRAGSGQGPQVRAALLTGDSAVGKTRLTRELCLQATRQGWTAGLLSPIAPSIGESLSGLDEDILIVVDDADARAGQLEALLSAVEGMGQNAHLKVLAVARQAGEHKEDWWNQLGRRYEAVASATEFPVPAPTAEDRFAAYEEAYKKFRSLLEERRQEEGSGKQPPHDEAERQREDHSEPDAPTATDPVSRSDLESEEYASFLLILIQALVDATASATTPEAVSAAQLAQETLEVRLLDRLLDLERQTWAKTVDPWLNADPVVLERVVAISSLGYADDGASPGAGETEAASTLRLVPDLSDATEQVRRAFARWEHRQYNGYGYLRALRPERLAQHVAARLIAAFPPLASVLLDVGDDNALAPAGDVAKSYRAVNTLRLLSNAAVSEPGGSEVQERVQTALRDALKERIHTLLRLSLTMVVNHEIDTPHDTAGKSLIAALESTIMRFPEAGAARDAADVLTDECPDVLLGLAVKVMRRATGFRAPGQDPAADDHDPLAHARHLRLLSRFLSDSGNKHEAREAAWEAVQESRRLERWTPTAETRCGLAHALTNLAVRLDEVGRYQEAVDAGREAVNLYDMLLRASKTRWSYVHLANGYSNLSLAAGHAGRWREALQWAIQARDLVQRDFPAAADLDDDPGDALDAARALAWHMTSRYLAAADSHQAALDAAKETVRLYEALSRSQQGVWKRDFARSLNMLGRRYAEAASRERAAEAASHRKGTELEYREGSTEARYRDQGVERHQQSVTCYEGLKQEYREAVRGEHADACRDLAASHFCRYLRSGQGSDLDESEKLIDAAMEGYGSMRSPDKRARLRGHALTLRWKARIGSYRCTDKAQLDEAAQAAAKAVENYEQLHSPSLWDRRRLAFARLVHARVLMALAQVPGASTDAVAEHVARARTEVREGERRIADLNEEEEHPDPEDIEWVRKEIENLLNGTPG